MEKVILIDGSSLMYRAYYATSYDGNIMKNSKGLHTNLVYTFNLIFDKILKIETNKILVAFDKGKITFRHDIDQSYKDGRSPMPEEMREQIPYLYKYLEALGIKTYSVELYEADDIIGTLARIAKENGFIVEIFSSDKDLLQLVDKNVFVNLLKSASNIERFDCDYLYNKYNIYNYQMIDYKAIIGDPSDNIKGVSGIGPKTAVKLLNDYDSIEGIYNNINNIKGSNKEKLLNSKESLLKDKKLVTINQNSPLEIALDDINKEEIKINMLISLYKELEYKSLLMKLEQNSLKENIDNNYKVIDNKDELKSILISSSIYLELDNENYHKANFVGLGICNQKGNYYIDNLDDYYDELKIFFEDDKIIKDTFDFKKTYVFLKYKNIELKGVDFDLLLASYLINPLITKDDFKSIVLNFDYDLIDFDENIYGKREVKNLDKNYSLHIINKTLAIKNLKEKLMNILKDNEQLDLYKNIEIPLSLVLGDMEYNGVHIDIKELNKQKEELKTKIKDLEDIIYFQAGEEFNIQSPKQLGVILFDKLNLPTNKKNKTGYSTDISVLLKLKDKHDIIKYIIDYRSVTKLYNTYIIGIENVLYNDKLHTIFKQTLTQTGRLSSIEPNLQNIPVKTEEGNKIRKFFVPSKGNKFLSCDYSQIELRVLASLANVEKMIEAFNNDEDIHTKTAMDIFNTHNVSDIQRRNAKAVNFGIIYGMSAFGLSEDLKINPKEADLFIKKYYEAYPEIKIFMDKIIEDASNLGYVTTIFNRRRYIPELKSNVYFQREFGKRTAMNAPIQGSAADILKKAMVDVYFKLKEQKLKSKILISVHDEIILDVFSDEEDKVVKLVVKTMEETVKMKVKLKVSSDLGENWSLV